MIGYPETFIEPPLGYYVREQMTMQVAKADPHRFTLYKTDFLPGTDRFSPTGASRFNLMFSRLNGWLGPVIVEWTPDEPGLAEARRQAVLATLQRAGRPIIPERVVIGPSPYPGASLSGLAGTESVNNFNNVDHPLPAGGAILSTHAPVGALTRTAREELSNMLTTRNQAGITPSRIQAGRSRSAARWLPFAPCWRGACCSGSPACPRRPGRTASRARPACPRFPRAASRGPWPST